MLPFFIAITKKDVYNNKRGGNMKQTILKCTLTSDGEGYDVEVVTDGKVVSRFYYLGSINDLCYEYQDLAHDIVLED